jgi:nicotinamide-nucleotide amidase
MFPDDVIKMAEGLLQQSREAGLRMVTAESCTGGLIAALLTEIPGSSDVFERGFVTYSNTAKMQMLGVDEKLIANHGAVSKDVAEAMAKGALLHADAQLSVAVTGIAGPGGGTALKPVGLVHIAVARKGGTLVHKECRFGKKPRGQIRFESIQSALELLFCVI